MRKDDVQFEGGIMVIIMGISALSGGLVSAIVATLIGWIAC